MNDKDFKFFEELLRRESGLAVAREKEYLLESRLMPVAHKLGLQGLEGIIAKLNKGDAPDLKRMVVESMTTNETLFFRDNEPFRRLKDHVLPYFLKARATQRTIRIWSSACSSGQEPYSIAMVIKEMMPLFAGWRIEIIATDISHDILNQAQAGVYTQFEVQRGLPINLLVKYFAQQGDKWLIRPEIKQMVTFKQGNLLMDIPKMGMFDIVLCRNVMIYFDIETKKKVFADLARSVKQDGVLILGGTETILGITEHFRSIREVGGIYLLKESAFVPEGSEAKK